MSPNLIEQRDRALRELDDMTREFREEHQRFLEADQRARDCLKKWDAAVAIGTGRLLEIEEQRLEDARCQNCIFGSSGHCHRYAPRPANGFSKKPERFLTAEWPIVEANYWCGEFLRRRNPDSGRWGL